MLQFELNMEQKKGMQISQKLDFYFAQGEKLNKIKIFPSIHPSSS